MTGHELAEWMNISYSTYRNKPSQYIQRLKDYCKYEQIRGGVIIEEIYISKYNKNLKVEQTTVYLKALHEHNNLIALTGLENTTGLSTYYGRQVRNQLFGDKPRNIDSGARGIIGWRERIWAVKLGENQYRRFTEQEEELFNTLITQNYIGKLTPEVIKARELILKCCIEEGYSAKEYQAIITERGYNFFNDVIQKFKDLTGYQVGSPTEHMIDQEWCWPEDVDKEYKQFLLKLLEEIKEGD